MVRKIFTGPHSIHPSMKYRHEATPVDDEYVVVSERVPLTSPLGKIDGLDLGLIPREKEEWLDTNVLRSQD